VYPTDPLELYHDYAVHELPSLLQGRLDEELQKNSMTLGEHVKALILGVVQECHTELFSSYRKRDSSSNSKSDATSETAIGQPQDAPQLTSKEKLQKMDQLNKSSTDAVSVSGWGGSTLFSGFSTYYEVPEKEYDDIVDFQMQWTFPKVPELSSKSSAPSYGQDTSALGTLSVLNPLYPFTWLALKSKK
jgi:hypothetical protein